MKKYSIILAGAFVVSSFGFAAGTDDGLKLEQLPEKVQNSIKQQTTGAEIRDIDREQVRGKSFYEVDFVKGNDRLQMKVDDSGKVVVKPKTVYTRLKDAVSTDNLFGKDIELNDLPEKVRSAVTRETKGGRITEVSAEVDDGIKFYEVEFEQGTDSKEITLDAAGKVVQRD